jgi:hypothetical protein
LLLVVATGIPSACGGPKTERPEPGPEREALRVTVENDLTPRTPVEIRLVSVDGGERFLGSVSPGRTRTFEFEDTGYAGQYQLTGETGGGRHVASRPFQLVAAAWILWRLTANSLSMGYGYRSADTSGSERSVPER